MVVNGPPHAGGASARLRNARRSGLLCALAGAVAAYLLGAFGIAKADPAQAFVAPHLRNASPLLAAGPGGAAQGQVYDPAASSFFSLLSFGAMRTIAPILYGNFQSPTAVSMGSGRAGAGPMAQLAGLDPAASSALDGILQAGLLPDGGQAEAQEFNVAPGASPFGSDAPAGGAPAGALNGFLPPTPNAPGAPPPIIAAGGIEPMCSDSEGAQRLQAGTQFWSAHQGRTDEPIDLPKGVFMHSEVGDPLGDLGPSGNPANLSRIGPAGDWCRPAAMPSFLSSPLENRLLWIALGIGLVGLVVFWLSRGLRLPA